MTTDPPNGPTSADANEDFDAAQHELLGSIGQALIAQSAPGTVVLSLLVTQTVTGQDVGLDFRVELGRQSGLTLPAEASDPLVEAVQQLVLLWRAHEREPFRTLSYHVTRGEHGPRFTSEFGF